MRKKWWLYIVIIVVIVVGGFWGWNQLHGERATAPGNNTATALAQETVVVKRNSLQVTVDGSGSIEPSRSSSLSFAASGTVAAVLVAAGQQVKVGQPLAKLDTTALVLQVKQAEASLQAAQAQLDDLQNSPTPAQLAAAEASYQSALSQYEKLKDSPSAESITIAKVQLEKAKVALDKAQSDYDKVAYRPNISQLPQSFNLQSATWDYQKALAQYKQATEGPSSAELAAAKSNVTKAEAQLNDVKAGPSAAEIASKEAALTQAQVKLDQARENMADATLVAPFAGTVVQVDIQPGDKVGANKSVMQLYDLDPLEVQVYLDETDVAQVASGQEASVSVDAFPDTTFKGKVAAIDWVAHVQSGVVLYPVTIDLEQTAVPLRPGMTADAEIMVTNKQDALVVPLKAVHTFGNRSFVFRKLQPGESVSSFPRRGAAGGQSGTAADANARATRRTERGATGATRSLTDQTPSAAGGQTGNTLFQQLREAGFAPVPVKLGVLTSTQAEILSGLKEGDVVSTASLSTPTGSNGNQSSRDKNGSFAPFGFFGRGR